MNRRDFLRTAGGAALTGSLLAGMNLPATASATKPKTSPQPFRKGAWAPRALIHRAPDSLRQRMAELAEAGISLLAPCIPVPYSPWNDPDYYTGGTGVIEGYPDWNPFQGMIEIAHEFGTEIHLMTSCFNIGREAPIFQDHPEMVAQFPSAGDWSWAARKQGNYACGMQLRAQKYVFDRLRTLVERYHPDGIHLDYIRTGTQCVCDYCVEQMARQGLDIRAIQRRYDDQRDLWLHTGTQHMLRKYGVLKPVSWGVQEPVPDDEELGRWIDWRIDRLTGFIAQMYNYTHKYGMELSCAVKFFWPAQVPTGAQDWVRWGREGIFDQMCQMDYDRRPDELRTVIRESQELLAGGTSQYWPGVARGRGATGEQKRWCQSPQELAERVQICKDAGTDGVMLFHSGLLDDDDLAAIKDF